MATFCIKESLAIADQQSIYPKYIATFYRRALSHTRFLTLILTISCGFSGFFIYVVAAPTLIFG